MQNCAQIVLDYAALPQHPEVRLPHCQAEQAVLRGEMRIGVVVSAAAGVTDALEQIFQAADRREELLQKLESRHQKIIEQCCLHFAPKAAKNSVQNQTDALLHQIFAELRRLVQTAAHPKEGGQEAQNPHGERCNQNIEPNIAQGIAVGEKLSSRIFAFVLEQNILHRCAKFGIQPIIRPCSVAGEELIALYDENLDFARSQAQIKDRFARLWGEHRLPVVAGFTAADPAGQTCLLGRGGSDFSAAIIAAALELATLDIWTDVEGIYSADPRLIETAKLWERLDFALVSEMAYGGAKVVHPKSISIALQKQIFVIVRSTFAPHQKGTLIAPHAKAEHSPGNGPQPRMAGLVLSRDSLLLHMDNPNMLEGEGYIAQIAQATHKQKISIDVCATSETSFSFSIHNADCNTVLIKDLEQIGTTSMICGLYKLCCIGHRIGADTRFIREVLRLCEQHGTTIQTISVGASHNNVTLLLHIPKNPKENPEKIRQDDLKEKLSEAAGQATKKMEPSPYTIEESAIRLLRDIHRHFIKDADKGDTT